MHIVFVVGRVLLVLIFIFSGGSNLLDLAGTAEKINVVLTVPDALQDFVNQLQDVTGMKLPYMLAMLAGIVELGGGLLIAFNIATRSAAAILALLTLVSTFYFHDFWNMAGDMRDANLSHVMKNLSITGGLLILVVLGSWRPPRPSQV